MAVDAGHVHLLSIRDEIGGPSVKPIWSRPRDEVSVSSVEPRFMREQVVLDVQGSEPLKLYSTSLRSNPWAAGVVRALGGDLVAGLGEDGVFQAARYHSTYALPDQVKNYRVTAVIASDRDTTVTFVRSASTSASRSRVPRS